MDYMKKLKNVHKNVIAAKRAPGHMGDQIWELISAMECLVTSLMEKERNLQDDTMEKVLIHDEGPTEVHLIEGNFLGAEETVCGERLHPICSIHITHDAIPVTCAKCIMLA